MPELGFDVHAAEPVINGFCQVFRLKDSDAGRREITLKVHIVLKACEELICCEDRSIITVGIMARRHVP